MMSDMVSHMNTIPRVMRISGISYANASAAIAPPRKSEPVSPMKTLAGLKLNTKKPNRPPRTAEEKMPSER